MWDHDHRCISNNCQQKFGRLILFTMGKTYSPFCRYWVRSKFCNGDPLNFILCAKGQYNWKLYVQCNYSFMNITFHHGEIPKLIMVNSCAPYWLIEINEESSAHDELSCLDVTQVHQPTNTSELETEMGEYSHTGQRTAWLLTQINVLSEKQINVLSEKQSHPSHTAPPGEAITRSLSGPFSLLINVHVTTLQKRLLIQCVLGNERERCIWEI